MQITNWGDRLASFPGSPPSMCHNDSVTFDCTCKPKVVKSKVTFVIITFGAEKPGDKAKARP